jgi:hypothetical protein
MITFSTEEATLIANALKEVMDNKRLSNAFKTSIKPAYELVLGSLVNKPPMTQFICLSPLADFEVPTNVVEEARKIAEEARPMSKVHAAKHLREYFMSVGERRAPLMFATAVLRQIGIMRSE